MEDVTERKTTNAAGAVASIPAGEQLDVIPGYQLEEKIGSGGYGEVWRAKAPGGLLKAVKMVYGTLSEARASRELKSLERIKTVRHPFILTLERIEIIDGRLLVVTELAEKSLRDHFTECQAINGVGIPREDLMRFIRDAADALDYMFEKHSLQHLDIKPENLLLLGNHVKVADFGLTKDLRDNSVSMVAGLTPLYAAPEVFEGMPSQHSDQYSLAVVYQTLLTGQPPFLGRTAAQLIAQHLHSPPDLSSLPPVDQSAIARALSKNPKRRFNSCREFVEALASVHDEHGESGARSEKPRSEKRTPRPTRRWRERVDPSEISLNPLPAVPLEEVLQVVRPTLVVGLGGFAGRVLRALRRRVRDACGGQPVPALRLRYVDTDEREILDALYGSEADCLGRLDVLGIPLKPPSAYRRNFRNLMEWISRRWLFNMPRSRRTEGVRALGRLALVDHYRDVVASLKQALLEIVDDEAVQQAELETGLECDRQSPRVFVVASTSGGTGSGTVFDVGYALRGLLSELDLRDTGLAAFLLNGLPAASSGRTLCGGNSIACLRELDYFCRTESYPGDASAGIPASEYMTPFPTAYAVNLGSSLGTAGFEDAAERVADYLHHALAGPAASILDHVRLQSGGASVASSMRAFATARVPFGPPRPTDTPADPAGRPDLVEAVASAGNRLFKTRGASRLLIANAGGLPEDLCESIRAGCGNPVTAIDQEDGDGPFICLEVEDVPLCDVEARLEDLCPEGADLAERLHTRTDIEWD